MCRFILDSLSFFHFLSFVRSDDYRYCCRCFYGIRYTKPRGQIPDYNEPVVMRRSQRTVLDFCNKLHKQLAKEFK
jgi:hypothetical protein